MVMPKIRIFAGHGRWPIGQTFPVPDGKRIKFFVRHGHTYVDRQNWTQSIDSKAKANLEQALDYIEERVVETVEEGQDCYDYILSKPRRITKFTFKFVTQVNTDTPLSKLVNFTKNKEVTDFYFLACRAYEGKWNSSLLSPSEVKTETVVSIATLIDRELSRHTFSPLPWEGERGVSGRDLVWDIDRWDIGWMKKDAPERE